MKKIGKFIKKYWIAVTALALVLVIGAGVLVYAEYTKSSRARRVIATYSESGTSFSSNYMAIVNSTTPNRKYVYTGSTETSAITNVTICNYPQGNPTAVYDRDINYVLSGRLVVIENGVKRAATAADVAAGMTVTVAYSGSGGNESFTFSSSNLTHTFTGSTLSRRAPSIDDLDLTFSPAFNTDENNVCLELTATPTPPASYADIFAIDSSFSTAIAIEPVRLDWEGYFNETGARNNTGLPAPTAHDGFNYVVTGTGTGSCKLSWRSDALEISEVFLTKEFPLLTVQTETVGGHTWNYIEFPVDSSLQSRYDLQFYYVEGTSASFASWATVKTYAKLEFTES